MLRADHDLSNALYLQRRGSVSAAAVERPRHVAGLDPARAVYEKHHASGLNDDGSRAKFEVGAALPEQQLPHASECQLRNDRAVVRFEMGEFRQACAPIAQSAYAEGRASWTCRSAL